jgi:POT family proton-dependent oligopeptide transporter
MAGAQKEFLGHPRGLVILFFTEMWERFSFYGMRALLVLYLTQHFLFGDGEAQGIYASYAALVYLMPVIGGIIADRFLGSRKAVIIGALLLVAGHFTMAFEGSGGREFIQHQGQEYRIEAVGRDADRQLFAVDAERRVPITITPEGISASGPATPVVGATAASAVPFPATIPTGGYQIRKEVDGTGQATLFLALSLIVVGVGFLKPNISTVVGALYAEGDTRRDAGFTIFYVGINLGSVLATLLCGGLGIAYGWKYGFGLAGFGMLAGLLTFLWGQKWLEGRAEPPATANLHKTFLGVPRQAAIYIGGIIAVIPIWMLLQRHHVVEVALTWLVPAIFAGLLLYSAIAIKGDGRWKMLAAIILTMFSVLFWTLFEQAGSSLTLFADRSTELPSWLNASQTNFFNPGMIVIFGPLMAGLWIWLGKRGLEPNVPMKFAIGLMLVGAGFLALVWGANHHANELFRVSWLFLLAAYFLHTMGELCLSPVGLSMITKLSVARMVGLMMGAWFMASALAHTLAGIVAQMTSSETVGGVVTDPEAALATYATVFNQIGWAGVIVGVVLLALSPVLKWMMKGVK